MLTADNDASTSCITNSNDTRHMTTIDNAVSERLRGICVCVCVTIKCGEASTRDASLLPIRNQHTLLIQQGKGCTGHPVCMANCVHERSRQVARRRRRTTAQTAVLIRLVERVHR